MKNGTRTYRLKLTCVNEPQKSTPVQALRNLIHLCSALHASPALGTIGVQDDVGCGGKGDEDETN